MVTAFEKCLESSLRGGPRQPVESSRTSRHPLADARSAFGAVADSYLQAQVQWRVPVSLAIHGVAAVSVRWLVVEYGIARISGFMVFFHTM